MRLFCTAATITSTTHCNTLQHTATHCNTLQHTATRCNLLQGTATHGNTLQHAVIHCSTLAPTTLTRLFCKNEPTSTTLKHPNKCGMQIRAIAFGVSFNLILQSESYGSLFNGTWPKRRKELDDQLAKWLSKCDTLNAIGCTLTLSSLTPHSESVSLSPLSLFNCTVFLQKLSIQNNMGGGCFLNSVPWKQTESKVLYC